VRQADRVVEVATLTVEERRRQVARAVAEAYGGLLAAAEELRVADEFVAVLERTLEMTEARVANGASPAVERNIAEVELLRARADRFGRQAAVDRARIEVLRRMGSPPTETMTVRLPLEAAVAALAAQIASGAAARPRPDGRSDARLAEAEVALAAAGIATARSEGRAAYALTAGYMRTRAGFPQFGFDRMNQLQPIENVFHNVTFGLSLTLPPVNRNQSGVLAAEALERRARHEAAARQLDVAAEVAAAESADSQARRALAVFSTGLVDLARRNVDIVRESYTLGAARLTDVLQEQRRFIEVEQARVAALASAFAASTTFLGALGELQ
jgi:outer membrane protein TolC